MIPLLGTKASCRPWWGAVALQPAADWGNTYGGRGEIRCRAEGARRGDRPAAGYELADRAAALASRSILAGIKTAAVINVGTATIVAIIGGGAPRPKILTGVRRNDLAADPVGAVSGRTALLAKQQLLQPWSWSCSYVPRAGGVRRAGLSCPTRPARESKPLAGGSRAASDPAWRYAGAMTHDRAAGVVRRAARPSGVAGETRVLGHSPDAAQRGIRNLLAGASGCDRSQRGGGGVMTQTIEARFALSAALHSTWAAVLPLRRSGPRRPRRHGSRQSDVVVLLPLADNRAGGRVSGHRPRSQVTAAVACPTSHRTTAAYSLPPGCCASMTWRHLLEHLRRPGADHAGAARLGRHDRHGLRQPPSRAHRAHRLDEYQLRFACRRARNCRGESPSSAIPSSARCWWRAEPVQKPRGAGTLVRRRKLTSGRAGRRLSQSPVPKLARPHR